MTGAPGRRRATLLAGAVLAGAVVLGGPAPVAAAAACSGTSGVTVVVDFGSLGGGVQTSCAAGDPSSGLGALSSAGHGYAFVPRQPGLVCQVDARPNPCNGAPTTAYWSYWHASRGGSWSYSTLGAGGYNPPPGSVEGWAFGAGRRPGIAPPAAPAPPPPAPKPTTKPAPKPAPKPTTRPPAAPPTAVPPAGAPPASGASARPGAPSSAAGAPSPSRSGATPSASAGTIVGSTGAQPAPTTVDSTTAPPEAVATEPASSSAKALGVFSLAVALIAALGLAGFLVARRRRGTGPPL
jgi:hypothetical protein